jgi:hypothetical protein
MSVGHVYAGGFELPNMKQIKATEMPSLAVPCQSRIESEATEVLAQTQRKIDSIIAYAANRDGMVKEEQLRMIVANTGLGEGFVNKFKGQDIGKLKEALETRYLANVAALEANVVASEATEVLAQTQRKIDSIIAYVANRDGMVKEEQLRMIVINTGLGEGFVNNFTGQDIGKLKEALETRYLANVDALAANLKHGQNNFPWPFASPSQFPTTSGCNAFGCWSAGGGCNAFGCW